MFNRSAPVIATVIAQHAEDAFFLWHLRDLAVRAAHYSLEDLAKLDARLEAHVDGLRVAGDSGWRLAIDAAGQGAGEAFTAALLAFESGEQARVQEVLDVALIAPKLSRGLVSALGWLPLEQASRHIKSLLAPESVGHRLVGISASAIHRRNPGPALLSAFDADEPGVKARVLRAAGELGLVDTRVTLRANLKANDPTVRFWAAWSNALLIGHRDAVAYLQNVAEAGGPFGERAAQMAMRRLAPNDAKVWLKRLVKELSQKRIAVIAAGALAGPEVIPFLIDQMKVPDLARVAGESFSLITGVRIDYDKLEGKKPEGYEAGPTDNPDDEDVAMDTDANLPWPDPVLIQKWWSACQGNFTKGTRYLLGQPITVESLRRALKTGYQRQRAAAAIELAILKPGRPLFEVRAPAWRQQQML